MMHKHKPKRFLNLINIINSTENPIFYSALNQSLILVNYLGLQGFYLTSAI